MYNKTITLTNEKHIKTLLDPYNLRILQIYRESQEPLTVKQVSVLMGEVHGKVYYHIKKLFDIDLLKLVKTKSINGIIAKYYQRKYDAIYYDTNYSSDLYQKGHVTLVNQAYDVCVNEFRKDIIKTTNKFSDTETPSKDTPQFIKQDLFMTPEEYQDFMNIIRGLLKKYKTKDETKEGFSILTGITRVK